jgi:acetyl esterase
MAKDRGMKDAIKAQVLFYPCLSETTDFPSYEQYGDGYHTLAQETMGLFYDLYLTKRDIPYIYATPIVASCEQLIGLPPALVITADCDILRDEGEAYAKNLMAADVDVLGIRVLSTIHGFMTMPYPTPQYISTFKTTVDFIKKHLDF